MSAWDEYPDHYRKAEIDEIVRWIRAGECVAIIGLSGSGKSNLLGFLARRISSVELPSFVLIDCNRLQERDSPGFFRTLRHALDPADLEPALGFELAALEKSIAKRLLAGPGLCFLLDRFDGLYSWQDFHHLADNLRALRDVFKYRLTFVIAARQPVEVQTEISELFFGHSIWLGPLSKADAVWSARRDAQRYSSSTPILWDEAVLEELVHLSWGYPSLLRACCEAYAAGTALTLEAMQAHPAVRRRVNEFWADNPDPDSIARSGLENQPFLLQSENLPIKISQFDTSDLTAKENLLFEHLMQHAGEVCEKDELIHAVWPEEVIFQQGIRDDSLAQLVRRLRVKIEPDPTAPIYIHTVPGRGYLFRS